MSQVNRITVYTTESCGYCLRVKALLESRGLQYTEVNLSRDFDARIDLARRTGLLTFPQVVVNYELIGGFNETLAAAQSGRLDELLAA